MADGYLPPVVVRLVAETAEAVAGLERFGASLEAIGVKARAAGAEIDASMAGIATSTGRVDASMTAAGASVDRFAAQATAANERTAASYTAPATAADRFAAQADADAARVAAAQDKVAASNQAMAAKMEADSAGMEAANARAATSTEKVGAAMDAAGAKSATASKSFGMIGLAAVAVGAEAIHMAGNFQQATDTLVTTAGEDRNQIDFVRKSMLDLSSTTGTSAQSMVQSMYLIESSHIHGADAVRVLTAAVQGAKVENSDLTKTTDALTTTMTDFHYKTQDAALVMSKMTAAVGGGKLNMEQFAGSLHTVENVAQNAGLSFEQTAGALSTLTLHGQSADQATQNLRNAIQNLIAPNQVATKEMAGLGINALDLSQHLGERGLTGTYKILTDAIAAHTKNGQVTLDLMNNSAIATEKYSRAVAGAPPEVQKMAQALHDGGMSIKDYTKQAKDMGGTAGSTALQLLPLIKNSTGFSDALKNGNPDVTTFIDVLKRTTGGTQGLAVALGLTGENAKAFQDNIDAITHAVPQADGAVAHWDDVQQRFNQKVDVAKESLRNLMITIGTDLLPVVTAILGPISDMADWLSKNKIAADILIGVLVGGLSLGLIAVGARVLTFVGGPLVSMVTGFGKVMGAIADFIAKMIGMNIATETATAKDTATVEEGATAQTTAVQEGMAKMVTATEEGMAAVAEAIRGGGVATTAAAETVGAETGTAQGTAYRTALLESTATAETAEAATIGATGQETAVAARAVGAEAGAAQGAGMAAGLATSEVEVGAAGAAMAGKAKAGFLGKFGRVLGDVGMVGLAIYAADQILPDSLNVEKNAQALVDHINHTITGEALSPSTQAVDASFGKMSNSVRSAMGLAKLYSDDGMTRLDRSILDGATAGAANFDAGINKMPASAKTAVDLTTKNIHDTLAGGGADAKVQGDAITFALTGALNKMPPPAGKAAQDATQGVKDGLAPAPKVAGDAGTGVNSMFGGIVGAPGTGLGGIAKKAGDDATKGMAQGVQPLPGNMKTAGGDSVDGFKQGFDDKSPSVLQGIKDWFSNQIREIKGILGIASPSTVFNSIGVDMMTGLWNGINSLMATIGNAVQNWINGTVAAIRATLGMRSPSRVMHEIGHHFMQGFHNGMMGQHQHNVDAARRCAQDVVNCYQQVLQDAHAPGWSQMQGWIDPNFDQESLIHQQTQQMNQHQGGHRNRWGCWVCGEDNHKPIECPNTNQVLTLTRRNSGIGVQDSTVQAGVTNNITVQGAVLDHQGMFQALQEAALRSGQRNSFTGGFGSPR